MFVAGRYGPPNAFKSTTEWSRPECRSTHHAKKERKREREGPSVFSN